MRRSLHRSETDKRWTEFFSNPGSWWDNRSKNVSDKWTNAPDFRHSVSGEALWITSCPSWVLPKLATLVSPLGNKGVRARLKTTKRTAPEFVTALKQCTQAKDITGGKKLHAEAVEAGFHTENYVAASLITMYCKCQEVQRARQVFDSCSHRDAVMWNSLILGCVENSESEKALDLFKRMTDSGQLQPTRVSFLAVLKACSALGSDTRDRVLKQMHLEKGIEIHQKLTEAGLLGDRTVAITLIDMYGNCGSMMQAKEVFDQMRNKDIVSWTCLMLGYVENGEHESAMNLFTSMKAEPDSFMLVAALKACAGLATERHGERQKLLEQGIAIHEKIKQCGCESNKLVASTLIDMYCKCGETKHARDTFDGLSVKDNVTWICLMRGYVENREYNKALSLFTNMSSEPDSFMCVAALKACAGLASGSVSLWEKESCLEKGMNIHRRIRDLKLDPELVVGNALVDMYSKCGNMGRARETFDQMLQKDAVTWNSLMLGYIENRECAEALKVFENMDCQPTQITFIAALKACSGMEAEKDTCLRKGIAIHKQLRDCVFDDADPALGSSLMNMYGKCGSMNDARKVFLNMSRKDVITWTCLIIGYVENEEFAAAVEEFDRMDCQPDCRTYAAVLKAYGGLATGKNSSKKIYLEKCISIHQQVIERGFDGDTAIVNSLIDLYGKCGSMQSALDLFTSMSRCQPNSFTYVSALKACESEGALPIGQCIHATICKLGLEDEQVVTNVLVDFYAKCGCMASAVQLFSCMSSPSIVSWNALISGYTSQGNSSHVFQLVSKLQDSGLPMNGITYTCVLTLCSHAGMVEKGYKFFELMRQEGVKPSLDHYTCMVDMLGRANRLEEALALVNSMPFQADEVIWTALLGACRKWNNIKVGKVAFDALMAGGWRGAAAPYVLMGDIFRGVKMQRDGERVESEREMEKAWKKPGVTWWFDSLGRRFTFVVGDEIKESVKEKLREVLRGYKSAETVEKDEACGHSEKLAIAHALVRSKAGETIRIVNNMRLCVDCHHATNHISKVVKREIICRDSSRIHIFRDGICSCGDYW